MEFIGSGYNSSDEESTGFRTAVMKAVGHNMPPRGGRTEPSWLLPGEVRKVEEKNVGYLSPIGKLLGKVVITNYRLRFESKDQTASGKTVKECHLNVPLGSISRVEKMGYSTVSRGEDSYGLEIFCKDFRNLKFSSRQENHSRRPIHDCLQTFAFPATNKVPFFAFSYEEKFRCDGWNIYDPMKEFKRMGVPNDTWNITRVNEKYEFADTYPSVLVVPAQAILEGDDFLYKVGTFRSKSRIPVLSWLHPETQASLTRCSQPMVGMTGRKSLEDEKYLQMIIDANAQSDRLFIMDARPEVNAKVNKAKGGGYESEDTYSNCQLVFLDIQNIHVMRESLRKLKEICFPRIDDKTWFSNLDDTHWLEHIKQILLASARIVDKIENHKKSVLVHCSDGWDRTAQLTSLAMIMLDPFYRSLTGFEVLVEKEWASFGHKFSHRIGHGDDKYSDAERSPVFLQFVDCVWQLTEQFPTAFEFNTQFLIVILDELYNCRFGTFLFNTEQQRAKEQLREKTQSVWSMINNRANSYQEFYNPLYNEATGSDVLMPCCSQRRIKLWSEYYLRYNPFVSCTERMEERQRLYQQLIRVRNSLRAEVDRLKTDQSRQSDSTTPKSPPPRQSTL